jgi:beta-glucuronidase
MARRQLVPHLALPTQEVHRQAIRKLVARDKNHPCVVIWSIANEPESDTPESRAYFEPLAAEARRLDPSRPVGFVNVMLAPADKDVISDLFDVLMLNRYYGWYVNTGICLRPSARSRPSSTPGSTSTASRSS